VNGSLHHFFSSSIDTIRNCFHEMGFGGLSGVEDYFGNHVQVSTINSATTPLQKYTLVTCICDRLQGFNIVPRA